MTAESTRRDRLRQPYLVRKIIYNIGSVIAIIAAVFFGATADHLDTIDRIIATLTPTITALVATLAAANANPGSDAGPVAPVVVEPTPAPDLAAALADVAEDVIEQVLGRVIPAGQHRADHTTGLDDLRTSLAVEG